MNFALGFTSFIIGVLAIVQSSMSSYAAERTNEKIQQAVNGIKEPVDALSKEIVSLNSISNQIHEKTEVVSRRILNLPSSFNQVEPSSRINDNRTEQVSNNTKDINALIIDNIIRQGSPIVRAVLVLLSRGMKSVNAKVGDSVNFNLRDQDITERTDVSAVVTSLTSSGLFDASFVAYGFNIIYDANFKAVIENEENISYLDDPTNVNNIIEKYGFIVTSATKNT